MAVMLHCVMADIYFEPNNSTRAGLCKGNRSCRCEFVMGSRWSPEFAGAAVQRGKDQFQGLRCSQKGMASITEDGAF